MDGRMDTARWLHDPELARLLATLDTLGETRFIGGCVRDALLGIAHSDIDLATTTLPQAAMAHVASAGFRVVGTGLAHGTFTAILPGGPVEVTTLRRDVETDGRHAVVAFTDDWHADAARRDFTINALSCGADGTVFDYFGGREDLAAGHVRFIGSAAARIAEDYLRILRFFRFTARFARQPDSVALAAIAEAAPHMTRLSGERIQAELLKLLAGPRAAGMWQAMIDTGTIAAILPSATDTERLARVIALEEGHGLCDPLRRLMGSLSSLVIPAAVNPEIPLPPGEAGEPASRPASRIGDGGMTVTELAERLKLSNPQRQRLLDAGDPTRLAALRAGAYGRALYKAEPQSIIDIAVLEAASGGESLPGLLAFLETWQQPKFPLGGGDLQAVGLEPGPQFGELLGAVETWWIDRDFRPTREECLAELRHVLARQK